jgi:hypothetical protein
MLYTNMKLHSTRRQSRAENGPNSVATDWYVATILTMHALRAREHRTLNVRLIILHKR